MHTRHHKVSTGCEKKHSVKKIKKAAVMPPSAKAVNDVGAEMLTVADAIFEQFCKELECTHALKEIAERFRSEKNYSEDALKKILFGDAE